MESVPRRKSARTRTVTKDSIPWKIIGEDTSPIEPLDDIDIERLAAIHRIDEALLRKLSGKLRSVLRPQLKLSQPDIAPARRKKGLKELGRANDLLRSAEGKLQAAEKILNNLRFTNDFGHTGMPNPGDRRLEEFRTAIQTIEECSDFFKTMEQYDMATALGTPDARKSTDVRRTILCVTIFNLWSDLERNLTYTTNPVSGERTGPLIDFVNDMVHCMTAPPSRLSGEAIKRELDDFLG